MTHMIEHNATITGYRRSEGTRGDGAPALGEDLAPLAAPCLLADPSDRLRARLEAEGVAVERVVRIYAGVLRGSGIGEPKNGDTLTVRSTRPLASEEELRVVGVRWTDGDGECELALGK